MIPIPLVVNIPARVLAWPLAGDAWWPVAGTVAAAALVVSRCVFQRSLARYRSASS